MPKQIGLYPRSSRPAGVILRAEPTNAPSFAQRRGRMTGKRRQGILYEDEVIEHLSCMFGEWFIPGPWFIFWTADDQRPRYCQPDGLLFDAVGKTIWIIEIKLKHTTDAWWQLRHLYTPVIAAVFPPQVWNIRVCEIVRWYDPAITFPEKVALVPQVLAVQPNDFGVHIWKAS